MFQYTMVPSSGENYLTKSEGSQQLPLMKWKRKKLMTKSKGFSINIWDSKIPYKEEAGGDPVNGRGQNIPLVTNIRSGLYRKAY